MIDWSCKFDVSEMPRAVGLVSTASLTELVFIADSHPRIIHSIAIRQMSLFIINSFTCKVCHRHPLYVVLVHEAEVNGLNSLFLHVGILGLVPCLDRI